MCSLSAHARGSQIHKTVLKLPATHRLHVRGNLAVVAAQTKTTTVVVCQLLGNVGETGVFSCDLLALALAGDGDVYRGCSDGQTQLPFCDGMRFSLFQPKTAATGVVRGYVRYLVIQFVNPYLA